MINYLITVIFILTIAITSGGILISSHLRFTYKADFFSTLMFFLVFYFTFGFYAIWGQLIINSYLSPFVSADHLGKVTDYIVLLGSPFLIFASLMFVRFSKEITSRNISSLFIWCFLTINIVLIFGIGFLLSKYPSIKALTVVKYYFIGLNFLCFILGTYYFLFCKKRKAKFKYNDLKNLSFGLIAMVLLQNLVLFLYNNSIYLALIFIFIYFTIGGFLPVYIKYKADLSKLLPENEVSISFEQFCKKFEISKRETEIIHEICKGLTNQQIADNLFISLQTVKDHTHRIYSKTDCTSRAQLIRMVNDSV